jgi:hypothetical protein
MNARGAAAADPGGRVETTIVERDGKPLLECAGPIRRPSDVLDLVGSDAVGMVVSPEHFPAEFFDLETGFAGEFLQKLENYGIRVAAVFPTDDGYTERFREFLREARRRGSSFRVFSARDDAERWLIGA